MKIIIAILLCASFLFGAKLGWSNDYKKTIALAKEQNKEVYILMTSSDCRWCRKFENTTLRDKKILEQLKSKYVVMHLDRDFDDFPKKFIVKIVPSHFFITSKEDIIYKFPGYWNVEDFTSFLKDIDKIDRF